MGTRADSRTQVCFVQPDWPAPSGVLALCTTAAAGDQRYHLENKHGPAASPLDLLSALEGSRAGEPGAVDEPVMTDGVRRAGAVRTSGGQTTGPRTILWLRQVHGTRVIEVPEQSPGPTRPEADASISRRPGQACAVLTADCLPVLFCSRDASVVAAAHAGWRGLASGILERSVEHMGVPPGEILAWLGPAIGPCHFEVGDEVRRAFINTGQGQSKGASQAAGNRFRENHSRAALSDRAFFRQLPVDHPASERAMTPGRDKWLADLYTLARLRLEAAGLKLIYGGGFCTVCDRHPDRSHCSLPGSASGGEHRPAADEQDSRFFSYRRQAEAGRMASVICRV